jgi:hypothetical protein
LLENLNKIDKPLARPTKEEKKGHINNIRNGRKNITTQPLEIKWTIKDYYG